jgi:WD40 repeat protein
VVKKASRPVARPARATAARKRTVRTSEVGDLLLISGAFGLSAHILSREPAQLAGQLIGRLDRCESRTVARLVKRAIPTNGRVWLRPGTNSLLSPGGPGVRRLEPKSGVAWALAVSLDTAQLCCGFEDGTIREYGLWTGLEERVFEGHRDAVKALVMVPGRERLVSGSEDHDILVWDLASGTVIERLRGHDGAVVALGTSPDGRRIFLGPRTQRFGLGIWTIPPHRKASSGMRPP